MAPLNTSPCAQTHVPIRHRMTTMLPRTARTFTANETNCCPAAASHLGPTKETDNGIASEAHTDSAIVHLYLFTKLSDLQQKILLVTDLGQEFLGHVSVSHLH